MATKVYIDGAISDPEAAHVSIFDRGFLFGDSVYEVMRTSGGRTVDLEPHLDRLERSAAIIALTLPPRDLVRRAVDETLRAGGNPESYIRVVVTRGRGEIGLDPALAGEPTLIVIVKPLALLPPAAYASGIKLCIVGVPRTPAAAGGAGVKSGNYLNNVMALHEARQAGADEAIMCDVQGRVAEGASSNLFVVRGDEILTPDVHIGLLQGITRERVMELARGDGIKVVAGTLLPDDVRAAGELFITSSVRGVVPVVEVDGQPLRPPVPGPVTARIMALYQDYLDSVANVR